MCGALFRPLSPGQSRQVRVTQAATAFRSRRARLPGVRGPAAGHGLCKAGGAWGSPEAQAALSCEVTCWGKGEKSEGGRAAACHRVSPHRASAFVTDQLP